MCEDGRAIAVDVLVEPNPGPAFARVEASVALRTSSGSRPSIRANSTATNGVLQTYCRAILRTDELSESFMTEVSIRKRFGVVADKQQRAMSGLEFVQGLVDGTLPLNSMAQTLGYNIVEVSKGRVVAAVEPHAGHLNPAGTVHGGLAATLLDSCMGLAIHSMLDRGFAQTTLEFKISLVRPITVQTGLVKAEGKVISCGRRIGTAEGKLIDKDGRVLAHGTTTCLIFEY